MSAPDIEEFRANMRRELVKLTEDYQKQDTTDKKVDWLFTFIMSYIAQKSESELRLAEEWDKKPLSKP